MSVAGKSKHKTPLRHAIEWVIFLAIGAGAVYAISVSGVRISPVMSNSMQPKFEAGDAVLYVSTATRTPQQGDVIVFTAHLDSTHALPVVHRWVGTATDGRVMTKGDNNERSDPWQVTTADIQGVQIASIPTHYLRNPWTIPISATALLFTIIMSVVLFILKKKNDENPVADDNEPTHGRRVITHQTATAQETALTAATVNKKRRRRKPDIDTLDWYSGGENDPDAPARFPWLEPTVRVIPPIPADNTFATLITETTRPQPVIPDGWTPVKVSLPADPADIYLAPQPDLPPRPHRTTPHGDTGNPSPEAQPKTQA